MTKTLTLLCAATLALSACSQPEPEPVYAQPTFDKAGNASCMGGYSIMTTDSGQTVCAPDA